MAGALSGEPAAIPMWRSIPSDAIESELAALWCAIGKETRISRALMGNLIVLHPAAVSMKDILDVARRHPVRIVLISAAKGKDTASGPAAARVSIVPVGDPSNRFGAELIAIDAEYADVAMGSIVLTLARGDVPTTIWWADDLSSDALPAALFGQARQLVYDSALWQDVPAGMRRLAEVARTCDRLDLADLNWRRLEPLRHAIVYAASQDAAPLEELVEENVRITFRTGSLAAALLLDGWLCCRLGWKTRSAGRVEEASDQDAVLKITFRRAKWALEAAIDERGTRVVTTGTSVAATPVPVRSLAELIASELRALGHDSCLRETIRVLAEDR